MNLCKDCVHHKIMYKNGFGGLCLEHSICILFTKKEINPVTGEESFIGGRCEEERKKNGKCGENGKYYAKKKTLWEMMFK